MWWGRGYSNFKFQLQRHLRSIQVRHHFFEASFQCSYALLQFFEKQSRMKRCLLLHGKIRGSRNNGPGAQRWLSLFSRGTSLAALHAPALRSSRCHHRLVTAVQNAKTDDWLAVHQPAMPAQMPVVSAAPTNTPTVTAVP